MENTSDNRLSGRAKIERWEVDRRHYMESLLALASQRAMISDSAAIDIQLSLYKLMEQRLERYTNGDSCSVRTEIAEQISRSTVFTLDIWLKNIDQPEDALKELIEKGAVECYGLGLKRIRRMVQSLRTYYRIMLTDLPDIPNYALNSTVIGGFEGFFKAYEPEFAAHDHIIHGDYPTMLFPSHMQGIEFITVYMKSIGYENRLLGLFDEAAVKRALTLYCIDCDNTVEDNVFNICEVVLSAALCSLIAGEDLHTLSLSDAGKAKVVSALDGEPDIDALVSSLLELMTSERMNAEAVKYIERAAKKNAPHICGAMKILCSD